MKPIVTAGHKLRQQKTCRYQSCGAEFIDTKSGAQLPWRPKAASCELCRPNFLSLGGARLVGESGSCW